MNYNQYQKKIQIINLLGYISSPLNGPTNFYNYNNFNLTHNQNNTKHFPHDNKMLISNKKRPKIINNYNCIPLFYDFNQQKISTIKTKNSYVNYSSKKNSLEQMINIKNKLSENELPYKIKQDNTISKFFLKTNINSDFSEGETEAEGEKQMKRWNSNLKLSKQNDDLYLTSNKKNNCNEYNIINNENENINGDSKNAKLEKIGRKNLLKSEDKKKNLSQMSQITTPNNLNFNFSQSIFDESKSQKQQEKGRNHHKEIELENDFSNNCYSETNYNYYNNNNNQSCHSKSRCLEIINNGINTMTNFNNSNYKTNFNTSKNNISKRDFILDNNNNNQRITNIKHKVKNNLKKYIYNPNNTKEKEKFNMIKSQTNKLLDNLESYSINIKDMHNRINSLKNAKVFLYKEGLGKDTQSLRSNSSDDSESSDSNLGFKIVKPKIRKGYLNEDILRKNDEEDKNYYRFNRLMKPKLIKQSIKPKLGVVSYLNLKDLKI